LLLPLVMILALFIVHHEQQPPSPAKLAAATGVVPANLDGWVRRIAAGPHVEGSVENARVRDLIAAEFTRLGMKPEIQSGFARRQSKRFSAFVSAGQVENIIAVLPGKDRQAPAVALMAHYDAVPFAGGAGDDAAGTAGVLEAARLLAAGPQPERDVVFLITDGEEVGLLGAQKFFNEHPLAAHVGAVVNVEARGSAGRALMFQTSPGNAALVDLWADHAVFPSGSSLSDAIYKLLPNDTDLSVSLEAGKIGINGSFIDGLADYHAPSDVPDNLNQGSLNHLASFGFTTTRALAMAKTLPVASGNATYFDVFAGGVVRYPSAAGWGLLALAGLGFGWLLRAARKAGLRWWIFFLGVVGALIIWTIAALTAHFVGEAMFPSGAIGSVERSVAMPGTLWAIGLIVAGIATLLMPRVKDVLANMLLLLIVGIAAQIWLPAGSWLFSIPLLLAVAVAIVAQIKGWGSRPTLISSFLLGGATFAWILQTVDLAWISVGTMTAGIVALAIPFGFVLLGPLILPWAQGKWRLAPGALLLVAGIGMAINVARSDGFDVRHPHPHDLFHVADAGGKSWWASTSGADELPGGKGEAFVLEPRPRNGWTATPAPAITTPEPFLTSINTDGQVQIGLKSDQPVRAFRLAIKPSRDLAGAKLNGLPVTVKGGEWLTIRYGGATPPSLQLTFPSGQGGSVEISTLSATQAPAGNIPLPKGRVASNWANISDTLVALKRTSFAW
jgi:Peptidase family M28